MCNIDYNKPNPILNTKELQGDNELSVRYEKLVEPDKVAELEQKTEEIIRNKDGTAKEKGEKMKIIATKELELDLLKGHYLEETCKVYLKTGELIEGMLTE